MSDVRKLIFAIVKFLKAQLNEGTLGAENAEGVEVGIQCLEAAYNISAPEPFLDLPCSLLEIFQKYLTAYDVPKDATPEEKTLAETLKSDGNMYMSAQNFKEAVACYTKAIKLDPKNPVYYCNRAAALNKLGNYESAIQDCKTTLKYDPSYSKAYGRIGLAYASMNKHYEAVQHYMKALELEPDNDSYKTNLKLAEEALASTPSASVPFQNMDLNMIFSNPNLLSMASQMLTNPSMQNMMSNIMSGNVTQEGGGMDVLLQASQQLAQQMESENPALVEQLRRHMGGAGDSSNEKKPPTEPTS